MRALPWSRAVVLLALALAAGAGLYAKRRPRPGPPAPLEVEAPALTPPIEAGPDDLFEDVTARAGIGFVHQLVGGRLTNIVESLGAGVCVLDFDGDGWPDLYLVNSGPLPGVSPPGVARSPNRLYRNRHDGTFEDVTDRAGVAGSGYGVAASAADFDNDGHVDLFVVNVGRSLLYRNRGDGTFEDVTERAGLAASGTGAGATWLDADGDGLLDLFVVRYLTLDPSYTLHYDPDGFPGPLAYKAEMNALYRNRGDGTFEDVSERSGVRVPGHRGMGVAVLDVDRDGHPDLYVTNDATPNLLLRNDGKGRFRDVALELGVAYGEHGDASGSMAAQVGDVNGDGLADIVVTDTGFGSLHVRTPAGGFVDRTSPSGLARLKGQYASWGSCLFDLDDDGDLDLFVCNGDLHHLVGWESLLLENAGDGTFADAAARGGAYFAARLRGRACVTLDLDGDGRLDLLATNLADRPVLLRSRGRSKNAWLALELEGTKSNRDGFGTLLTLTVGGRKVQAEAQCPTGYLSQSQRRLHFGLGPNEKVDRIELRWPSGQVQVLADVPARQVLHVREPGERGR